MNAIKTPPYSTTSLSDGSISEKDNSDNYVKLPENEIINTSDPRDDLSLLKENLIHFKESYLDGKCLDNYPEHKTAFRAGVVILLFMFIVNGLQSFGNVMLSYRMRKFEYALSEHKASINELYRTKYNFILDTLHECKIDSNYYPPQEPTHEPFI